MIGHLLRTAAIAIRPRDPHAPVFEVFRGLHGWTWHERASNGQISGGGGQGTMPYASKWNAKRAATTHAYRVAGSVVRMIEPVRV